MGEGTSAAQFIRANTDEIFRCWFHEASKVASARGLARPEFANIMPKYLAALGAADGDLGTFSGPRRKYIESHLSTRIRQGFSLQEVIAELGLVRTAAETVLAKSAGDAPPAGELHPLWTELGQAAAALTDLFATHMAEDEQVEKHYLLRLRNLATGALHAGAVPLRQRLDEVLTVFMEAMGSQSATLLLYDADARELGNVASVGLAADQHDYVASLDITSFEGQIAASEEPLALDDVATTRLAIPDALRRSGVQSLLGMRLPERATLTGVVYVGICERRAFTARETARLEVLGEQLTLHLDNAALVERLQANIAALEEERALRERFVSILAHDLRGPLSSAQMAAHLLLEAPVPIDLATLSHRDLLTRIDRNLDRTDRMVRDLLDANRVHVGEKLPLEVSHCDLVEIAREVTEELSTLHGARFSVAGDQSVGGRWDAGQLRRCLWNLGVNAVTYGSAGAPIIVCVRAEKDHAEMSVHNEGAPIRPEDRETLFSPFMRAASAQATRAKGWGLGLTLVRGAAEAHGGRVRVVSNAETGTTFTLELPYEPADL